MRLLKKYQNGNETVYLYEDGTKIRETDDDEFRPEFPESCDVTISTVCDNGCRFCYMNCSPEGKHADFSQYSFLNNMHPGMEMAINLNFPLHNDIVRFLASMKEQGVYVNATINENHFMKHRMFLKTLIQFELLHGIGVSYTGRTDNDEFINAVQSFPNIIIHTIAGLITEETISRLADHDLKILVLGYKNIGRGKNYLENNSKIQERIEWLGRELPNLTNRFRIISFDNLAIEQLQIRRWLNPEIWDERFQGEEGTVTFYIDLVNGIFARDSLIQEKFPIGNKSLKEMFGLIQKKYA